MLQLSYSLKNKTLNKPMKCLSIEFIHLFNINKTVDHDPAINLNKLYNSISKEVCY